MSDIVDQASEQEEPAPSEPQLADAAPEHQADAAPEVVGEHARTDTHAIIERAGSFLVIALSIGPLADVVRLIDGGHLPSHPDIRSYDDLDDAKRAAGLEPR